MIRFVTYIANLFGYEFVRSERDQLIRSFPVEATIDDQNIIRSVYNYTMTSDLRLWALISAVSYLVKAEIEGDFVECGVWRGGSAMAMALKLRNLGSINRNIWLYDTFNGMSEPTHDDKESASGLFASDLLKSSEFVDDRSSIWCRASLETVQKNLISTRYPKERINFVEGDVRDTLYETTPKKIALLRLDTDWYLTTKLELEVLFPKLQRGGICIIDDYGHWDGARKAVDEFINDNKLNLYLHRIDETGRLFIKI